jgi:hypothetical protein
MHNINLQRYGPISIDNILETNQLLCHVIEWIHYMAYHIIN